MKSWAVTEEEQMFRKGEEGKGEMHHQTHGHSGDDKEEVLRNKLDGIRRQGKQPTKIHPILPLPHQNLH